MKSLENFRITRWGIYTPTPLTTGLGFVWFGLGLIIRGLWSAGRRLFYRVQARLIWLWLRRRKYTTSDAVGAWGFTYYSLVIGIILIRFVFGLLS